MCRRCRRRRRARWWPPAARQEHRRRRPHRSSGPSRPGRSRVERTLMRASGRSARSCSRTGRMRSTRSSSAITTFGAESLRPYSSSVVVHQAFMPTTAAPRPEDRPVRDDPLGVVAHGDGDPVARADAVHVAQVVGERADLRVDLGVGVALVLEHDVGHVAAAGGELPQHPHVRRCGGEHPHRNVPHGGGGHGEGGPVSGQLGPGGVQFVDHGG